MHRSIRRALAGAAAVGLALLGVGLSTAPAAAATVTVDSTADDGSGGTTLREALAAAAPGDTIDFSPLFDTPQTINLLGTSLIIDKSVTIQGPGVDNLTIQRANNGLFYALFFVLPSTPPGTAIDVTINDVTMHNDATNSVDQLGAGFYALNTSLLRNLAMRSVVIQNQYTNSNGGAITVEAMTGTANFTDVTLRDSIAAGDGGGLWLAGATSVTIADSLIDGNTAQGNTAGGVHLTAINGMTSITNTTFIDNTASPGDSSGHGGALRFTGVGDVDIIGSVFDHNIASDSGGAVGLGMTGGYGDVTISNTTFARNESQSGYGGAIFTDGSIANPFTIARSTFDDNSATSTDVGGALGGAIYVNSVDEPFTIDSTTFTRNSTNGLGTSLAVDDINDDDSSVLFIVNSTFDEDLTSASGGRMIYVETNNGAFAIAYATLVGYQPVWVGNPEPGASTVTSTIVQSGLGQSDLFNADDPFLVRYSILSKPHEPLNVTDLGNNQFSTNALLGILDDNGGPTLTRMPAPDSPAVGMGGPTLGAPLWDQRFDPFPRIDGVLDVGAVEVNAHLPATGAAVPLWIPIVGGIVLLVGLGALVFAIIGRRRVGG